MRLMAEWSVVDAHEVSSGVVQISMHDRVHKNGFSSEMVDDLVKAFEWIRRQPECKVAVLTGYDTYFVSGGTQDALMDIHKGVASWAEKNLWRLAVECEIPVIAAMQGHGIGAGLVFGLCADLVVLSRESVYTANFMNYGFTPGMGATCILPRKLGTALAQEMLLSGGTFSGADLERRGVPFPVIPRREVLAHALMLATQLAEKPRACLTALKAHLVANIREELPRVVAQELAMQAGTVRDAEVAVRIRNRFGKF